MTLNHSLDIEAIHLFIQQAINTYLLSTTCCHEGQEAAVGTGHGTTDWFQIGKGVRQGYIWSSSLFNLYAEYIMRNTGLDEA